jgi:hypothetical protein
MNEVWLSTFLESGESEIPALTRGKQAQLVLMFPILGIIVFMTPSASIPKLKTIKL